MLKGVNNKSILKTSTITSSYVGGNLSTNTKGNQIKVYTNGVNNTNTLDMSSMKNNTFIRGNSLASTKFGYAESSISGSTSSVNNVSLASHDNTTVNGSSTLVADVRGNVIARTFRLNELRIKLV